MSSINLTSARRMINTMMIDSCVISNDVLSDPDPLTGAVTTTTTTVYTGKCLVSSMGGPQDPNYQLVLPPEVTVERDMHVRMTTAIDPAMQDQVFTVVSQAEGTYSVARIVTMVARTRVGE